MSKTWLLGSTDDILNLCYSFGLTPSAAGMVEDICVVSQASTTEYQFMTIDGYVVARRFCDV